MTSNAHPDYLGARKERQWRGLFECLWQLLTRELEGTSREARSWHWRILPNGVVVALRRIGAGDAWRYELRLARRSVGNFRENDVSWEGTVRYVLKTGGNTGERPATYDHASWHRTRKITEAGRRVVFYRSLLRGEIKPGVAECWTCRGSRDVRTEVDCRPGVGPRGQRCDQHGEGM